MLATPNTSRTARTPVARVLSVRTTDTLTPPVRLAEYVSTVVYGPAAEAATCICICTRPVLTGVSFTRSSLMVWAAPRSTCIKLPLYT